MKVKITIPRPITLAQFGDDSAALDFLAWAQGRTFGRTSANDNRREDFMRRAVGAEVDYGVRATEH